MSTVAEGARETDSRSRSWWRTIWPAALGLLVAAGTAFGLEDGRDVAAVVAASGFVYLAAAALGRRGVAWSAFGLTFVLVTLAKLAGMDAMAWILVLAGVMLVVGLARRRWQPTWGLPLQAAAMLVLGAVALLAVQVNPQLGGLLVSAALLAHAGWDLYHHRTGRVVTRSLAEFCCVLDVAAAAVVAVVALTT
jgi:hypothetical protein